MASAKRFYIEIDGEEFAGAEIVGMAWSSKGFGTSERGAVIAAIENLRKTAIVDLSQVEDDLRRAIDAASPDDLIDEPEDEGSDEDWVVARVVVQ